MYLDAHSVAAAADRLAGRVRATPTVEGQVGDCKCATLKLELLQHTGSFKARGALNRALTSEIPQAGLIAASGGNHGLAVAWVAATLGVPAEIFVPRVSPAAKVDLLGELGATVRVTGDLYDHARQACEQRQRETGALDIHPYDHIDTVTATATIGREFEDQSGSLDTVIVSVGGGGLAAGVAAWFSGRVRVVTVEPETSQCYAAAVRAGEPVDVEVGGVAADSLGARRIGTIPWDLLRGARATPVVVTDQAIVAAQRWLWTEHRLIAEPGGATAVAAVASGAFRPEPDERVGIIVCGSNCDPSTVVTTG